MRHRWAVLGIFFCFTSAADADDYTLFNPVPDDQMRAMNTERPSKTDSTTTLDPGHVQIETNALAYTYTHGCQGGDCTTTKQNYFGGSTNLRIGLTESADFQILTDLFHDAMFSDKTAGTRDEHQGFGDTVLRYKYNFWGNDGGETALAVIPFVKLPTNQNDLGNHNVEGGIEFPFAWNFADSWSLGGQTQVNFLRDDGPSGNYKGYVNSLVFGKNLNDQWSSYAELYTSKTDIAAAWQNTADFGIVYAVNDRLRVDTGVNLGITRAADDFNWFTGFAYRF